MAIRACWPTPSRHARSRSSSGQLWEAQFQTLAEATVRGNYEMELSFGTEDFKEGVAHFVEKRPARFTGR